MAASVETLEAQLAAAMIVIGFLAKQSKINTADLKKFAASTLSHLPEPRKSAVQQTLHHLVDTYEAVA